MLYLVPFVTAQEIAPVSHEFDAIGELVEISLDVSDYRHEGTKIVRSESDYHILTDVAVDQLFATFTDRNRQAEIIPRVLEYDAEPVPGSDGYVVIEHQVVGIRFMGFDATYDLEQRSEVIDRRDYRPPEFVIRYRMVESLDGKLESSSGAFLVRESRFDGRPVTYIRQRNITEIRDTFFGLKAILRRFTPSDTEQLMAALIADARLR